jgi:hypothetical protein
MTTAKKSTKKNWSAVDDGDDDKPKSYGGKCSAYGCPLLGSVSPSMGGHEWICYPHKAVSAIHWPEVTKRLNNEVLNVDLAIALRRISNGQAVELRILLDSAIQAGRFDLMPVGDELEKKRFRTWSSRVEKILCDKVTDGMSEVIVTESGVPARTGEQIMTMVAEYMKKRGIQPQEVIPA